MAYTTLISVSDLAEHLADPAFVIVDCRHNLVELDAGERDYRAAHITGAHFLHLDRDLSGVKTGFNVRHPLPEIPVLASTLGLVGIVASKQVVTYHHTQCMTAARLWGLHPWLGHEHEAVLDVWLGQGVTSHP